MSRKDLKELFDLVTDPNLHAGLFIVFLMLVMIYMLMEAFFRLI